MTVLIEHVDQRVGPSAELVEPKPFRQRIHELFGLREHDPMFGLDVFDARPENRLVFDDLGEEPISGFGLGHVRYDGRVRLTDGGTEAVEVLRAETFL